MWGKVAIATVARPSEVVDRAVPDPSFEQAMRFSTGRAGGRWPSRCWSAERGGRLRQQQGGGGVIEEEGRA